jgi:hypothetical protein
MEIDKQHIEKRIDNLYRKLEEQSLKARLTGKLLIISL